MFLSITSASLQLKGTDGVRLESIELIGDDDSDLVGN